MVRTFLLITATTLTACTAPEIRVANPAPISEETERVNIRFSSVEVALTTMPSYAQTEEIFMQAADGTLGPLGPLWSDEPSRAMTLQVAKDLSEITGQLVAPDPWPFRDFADAKLDIRISDFFVSDTSTFRMTGQYFVAPEFDGRDIAQTFEIEIPVVGDATFADIAVARTAAIRQLSLTIATNALR